MSIVVNLMSQKKGEISKYLNCCFDEDTETDRDVVEWIYVYNNSDDAVNMIKLFEENSENYDISLWVKIDDEELVSVKSYNIEAIIKRIHKVSETNKENKCLKIY